MTLNSALRAAVLSLALGAAAIGAVPAQAAGPHMSFGFGFGMGDRHFRTFCLPRTDYQIRRAVASAGYHNIYLNSPINRRIEVRATKGGWVYLLEVSICTGEILDRQRLRHA
jgi:hypothetical protein